MKKIIFFFLAFTLISSGVFAQSTKAAKTSKAKVSKSVKATKPTAKAIEKPAEVATPKVQGPDMTFETTIVDFGTIQQGSEPVRVAKFTNNGTEPLLVKSANGSCGCTVPTWPKDPIMPGETSEIKVRYDTNRVGDINKTVTVNTNIEGKQIVLSVKGKVLAKPADASAPAGTKNMMN